LSDSTIPLAAMPWRIAEATLTSYGQIANGLFAFQRSLLYQVGSDVPDLARAAVEGFRAVTVTTPDGLELTSWFRAAAPGMATLLVSHGNAGHIGHRVAKLAAFAEAGYGLFMVGYRGFGGNPGTPDEQGLYTDARAGLAWLERHGVPAEQVVAYGESLGTAVAVEVAGAAPVAAVVLESPYTSLADVAASHYWYMPFAGSLVPDRFEARKVIGKVEAPVLMLHGKRDTIIPVRQAEELFEAANEPRELAIIPQAGHMDLYDHGAAGIVKAFLGDHLKGA
jgi:fermentation-respiration switch protein FrsA (DUF1100 family)